MKKHIPILCFILLFSGEIFAQQEPLFSQYRTNAFVINPAVAGSSEHHELRFNFRSQWRQFPGAPRTVSLTWQGAMDEKSGVGLMAFADAVGPNQRTGLQLAYAFHIPIGYEGVNGQNKLALGMAGKFMQFRFQGERVYFQDTNDPAIYGASQGLLIGDVAFGAHFYNDNFFAGFSAPNLMQSSFGTTLDQSSRSLISKLYRHYFAFVGYKFVYDNMSIEPSVLIKKVQTTPYQIEGNIRFYFVEDRFFAGVSYRTDWFMTFMVGVHAKNLHFVYSSDLMLPNAKPGLLYGASNEFTLGYDIGSGSGEGNTNTNKSEDSGSWKKLYREE
ncbi:MAG: type IX secretion system membrane protein PorP/SprF [Bacteroidia bacterium]|nr:type IX secretion system membrane protein PorP/SprF [Bacteroidia bacterium]